MLREFATTLKLDRPEQILTAIATQAIRHLFSASEVLDVSVRGNQILNGHIDSFKLSGQHLVIRKDFYAEAMSIATDAVNLDFSAILQGKIRLKQPTQAVAQVVLSEGGMNHAFGADLVTQYLQNLTHPELLALSGDRPVSFSDISLKLLPDNQVQVAAHVHLANGIVPVCVQMTLEIARRRRIRFTNAVFIRDEIPAEQQSLSEILSLKLAAILDEMVDLDRFNLDGITLRLNRMETQGQYLLLSGYAEVHHFPGHA